MKKYIVFISSYLFLFLLFFVFPLDVHASEVNYESEPISFSGTQLIELTDKVDDSAVLEEYGIMMASSGSSSVSMSSRAYFALMSYTTPAFQLVSSGLSSDEVYAVTLSFNYSLTPSPTQSDTSLRFRNCHAAFASLLLNSYSNNTLPYSFSGTKTYYLSGETLMASNTCLIRTFLTASNSLSFTMNINFNIQVDSCVQVSGDAEAAYNEGYNAGYTAGEDDGYYSGFSAGVSSVDTQSYYNDGYAAGHRIGYAEGQAAVDTDAIYNQAYSEGLEDGFDEGVASVDTQSYYDAGYQVGYAAAYSSGYDEGYSSGYDDAMSRIEQWGADTSNYPKLLNSNVNNTSNFTFDVLIKSSIPTQYESFFNWKIDRKLNPNHTYMFEVEADPINISSSDEYAFIINKAPLYLDVGGISYLISNFEAEYNDKFYVPGDRMSTAFSFVWRPYCAYMGDSMLNTHGRGSTNIIWKLYDCGPSGDTQNHIANQTDQIMNTPTDNNDKYNSDLDSFDSELDSGISSEEDIMSEQNENITNFEYKPIGEFTGLTSAMSFYSAVVTSAFSSLGDFQGLWVISLTIIVIMVLLRISRRV